MKQIDKFFQKVKPKLNERNERVVEVPYSTFIALIKVLAKEGDKQAQKIQENLEKFGNDSILKK